MRLTLENVSSVMVEYLSIWLRNISIDLNSVLMMMMTKAQAMEMTYYWKLDLTAE